MADTHNKSACKDLTAYKAIKNADNDDGFKKVTILRRVIFIICDLAGYKVAQRIVLKDKKSGKVWE